MMTRTPFLIGFAVALCAAQQTQYGQCGQATQCAAGYSCCSQNQYYSQCLTACPTATTTAGITTMVSSAQGPPSSCAPLYSQCGGSGWNGATCCQSGYSCSTQNTYYAQCVTPTNGPPITTSSTIAPPKSSSSQSTGPVQSPVAGKLKYGGVNIAGFDFGTTEATGYTCGYQPNSPDPPLPFGITQMNHFVTSDGLNAFRLPVTWQYLVANNFQSNTLDVSNAATYDKLVQGCLNSNAALCVIDLHNYARVNGSIIGQGGPSTAQFASLWSQVASKYQSQSRIAFGLMNEPHDGDVSYCPNNIDVPTWQKTLQAAITAIRNAGASTQMILLPGKDYLHPQTYLDNSGVGSAIVALTNPDGSKTNLVIDVHEYLDTGNTGNSNSCDTNRINGTYGLSALAVWLRSNSRTALITETGGANNQNCVTLLRQTLGFLAENTDVYLGYIGWAAGSFGTDYVLSETPNGNVDQLIVSGAIAPCFTGSC